ncbi:MAG: hypothetical protein ABI639_03360 [Thermoanaerobaculia bacterium]
MKIRTAILALLLLDLAAGATWFAGRFGPLREDAFRLFVVWALPGLIFLCGKLAFGRPALRASPPALSGTRAVDARVSLPPPPPALAGASRPPGLPRLALWILIAILVDQTASLAGQALGWAKFVDGDALLAAHRLMTALWAWPLLVMVSIRFSEGTLRGELFRLAAEHWGRRLAWSLTLLCGTALALPAIAPGASLHEPGFVAAALVTALAREIGCTVLYLTSGLVAAGVFRGTLAFVEFYLLADSLAPVVPSTLYLTNTDAFYLLRGAAALVAALLLVRGLGARRRAQREGAAPAGSVSISE